MSNFLGYSNKLRSFVPILTPEQAEDMVNRAWREIRASYDGWTFLVSDEYWLAPAAISLTDLTLTQFSTTVGLGYASVSLLAGLNNPALTLRQLRMGQNGGPVYSIASTDLLQITDGAITALASSLTSPSGPFSVDDVGKKVVVGGAGASGTNLQTTIAGYVSPTQVTLTATASTTVTGATVSYGTSLTLARTYNEDSTSGTGAATCLRYYYSPLSSDFARIDHLSDPRTGYEFGWDIGLIDELDRIDPQRSSQGDPWRVYFHGYDSTNGLPTYELWPTPRASRAYKAVVWGLGNDFADDTDSLPYQIPEELLLMKARMLAYEFGMTQDQDVRKRQTYSNALSYIRGLYYGESQPGRPLGYLDEIIRADKNRAVTLGRRRPRNPGPGWPIDSNFAQRHAIPGGYFN